MATSSGVLQRNVELHEDVAKEQGLTAIIDALGRELEMTAPAFASAIFARSTALIGTHAVDCVSSVACKADFTRGRVHGLAGVIPHGSRTYRRYIGGRCEQSRVAKRSASSGSRF